MFTGSQEPLLSSFLKEREPYIHLVYQIKGVYLLVQYDQTVAEPVG